MIINNNDISLAVIGISARTLFGQKYTDEVYSGHKAKLIIRVMVKFLEQNPRIRKVHIGMSSGISLLFGTAVYKFKQKYGRESIHITCYIRKSGQLKGFTKEEQLQYYLILKQTADKIERMGEETPSEEAVRDRNKYLVTQTDMTVSFWNLIRRVSDTFSIMNFARKNNKPVYLFDSHDMMDNGIWWNPPGIDSNISINPVWKVHEPTPGELLASGYASDM
jgi:uncharacterized phage-like protein YoqJ